MPLGAQGSSGAAAHEAGGDRPHNVGARGEEAAAHRRRGGRRHKKRASGAVKILQANVRKGGASTEAALRHAEREGVDFVLLQEPRLWWSQALGVWVPRSWPTFEAFLPQGHSAGEMPRVVTYVARHRKEMRVTQRQDVLEQSTPDVLVLEACGVRGPPLRVVNVYSAPPGSTRSGVGVRELTRQQLSGRQYPTLVAGDFNAHHHLWSAVAGGDRTTMSGRRLANWLQAGRWSLGLETGTITRRGVRGQQDSAIDLVLLSSAMGSRGWSVAAEARPDLTTASDHLPVCSTLWPPDDRGAPAPSVRPLNMKRTDWDIFDRELQKATQALDTEVRTAKCAQGEQQERAIDEAFACLQTAIKEALEASTPRCKGSAKGCEWWDKACDDAVRLVRMAEVGLVLARAEGVGERRARRHLQRASKRMARQLAQSKRRFFDARISELQGNAIFGAMRWSGGASRRYRSPPMRDSEGVIHAMGTAKMTLLRQELLPRPEPVDLELPDLHTPTAQTVGDSPLSREELRAAIFGQAQNKAAGPDEITFAVLRRAWDGLEEQMFALFALALGVGWHPRPLRSAILVALPKSGKTLEKIAATRLATLGLQHGWIAGEQFGSIAGRSTTDAALSLLHDIEAGWTYSPPKVTSALTIDVRGAYDAVHWIRLICLLYRLGVPLGLLRWLTGFLTERKASMRLDGETGPMEEVETGIPQGSPVSPVLYILFAATLHKLFGPGAEDVELRAVRLISYVDDNLLYTIGTTTAANLVLLARAYSRAHQWALDNGMRFDPGKRELIHFVAPRFAAPENASLHLLDGTVEAVGSTGSVKWLGIHLDPRLHFTAHVTAMAQKGRKAAGAMCMLMNTRKGMRVADARRLYVACVRGVMAYAAVVWWQGFSRDEPGRPLHGQRGRRVIMGPTSGPPTARPVTHSRKHVKLLETVQHEALRRALPAYRTTSMTALQVEASCPPIDIFLDEVRDKAALRLLTLQVDHPLLVRAGLAEPASPSRALEPAMPFCDLWSARARPYSTRATQLARRIGATVERPLAPRPGLDTIPGVVFDEWTDGIQLPTMTDALNVYTDGSMLHSETGEARTGAGWVLAKGTEIIERGHVYTGANREVFDAEVVGLYHGTVHGVQRASLLGLRRTIIHADNQAALLALRSMKANSSFLTFAKLHRFVTDYLRQATGQQIWYRWVRGHAESVGNKTADDEAKKGAQPNGANFPVDTASTSTISLATARRRVKERAQGEWRRRWDQERLKQTMSGSPSVYFQHRLTPPSLRPSPLLATLSRKEFALLLHLRTGHGDFAEYHERFHHTDADTTCVCGERFTRLHPLVCEASAAHQPLLRDEDGAIVSPTVLLGTDHGATRVLAYSKASRAFAANQRGRACPADR